MTSVPEVEALRTGGQIAGERLHRRFDALWAAKDDAAHALLDQLAAQAVHDDRSLEALIAIVQRHRLARPAIRRLVLDADDVDDIEQSTLAIVASRLDQFEQRSRFTTWLFRVATNEAKMLLRTRSRRPQAADAEVPEGTYLARLSSIVADQSMVTEALAQLSDDYRAVLILREYDRLDYDEIARVLDVPVGTVRSRLNRARQLVATLVRAASITDPGPR